MPPSSRSSTIEETSQPNGARYVDVDVLRNSHRLVAIFSQCRWDGKITFSIQREYDKYNPDKPDRVESVKTAFVPEGLAESYADFTSLVLEHVKKLKAKRLAGELPFPEGGAEAQR
jgi:hypothetical protein